MGDFGCLTNKFREKCFSRSNKKQDMKDNNEAKRKRVESFLKENYKGEFIISETPNEEGRYEVSSSGYVCMVRLSENLTTEDFVFTEVSYFSCSRNERLLSLEGSPRKANVFNCDGCTSLQTLEGAPQEVEIFDCYYCNSLRTLKGAPERVGRFDCSDCKSLKSLKYAPKKMKNFICQNCPSLKSLNINLKDIERYTISL